MYFVYLNSLVCEVAYQLSSDEPMLSASRYYKFQVLKPCEVKTKFYNAEVSYDFFYKKTFYTELQCKLNIGEIFSFRNYCLIIIHGFY